MLIVDRHRAKPLDGGAVAGRSSAVDAESGRCRQLEDRGAHPASSAVHEHRLPALRVRGAVKHLVGRHVGEDEAENLSWVEIFGHIDRVPLRHADALCVGAPLRQCSDAVPPCSLEQPGPSSSTVPTSS